MKKLFKGLFAFLMIAVLALSVLAGLFLWDGMREADHREASQPLSTLVESVRAREDFVPYDQVAPMLYEATIAVEDARYMSHGAIDLPALARAAISQVIPWMPKSGGSTIAMQVVKNLYGVYDGGVTWKAAEIVLATRLCRMYSKEEILALYVNIINYGDGYHGIYDASMGYYGLHPSQLSDGMATLLAGVPQRPDLFAPRTNFEQARAKQRIVLDAMVRNKMITSAQADEIFAQPCAPSGIEATASGMILPVGRFVFL